MRAASTAACLLLLTGCGGNYEPAQAPTATAQPAPLELPDGRTATPQQQAFLDEVLPQLEADHASDVLRVLQEGESVCTVFLHPSDPTAQQQAVDLFTRQDWSETEAWVMVRAGAKHFCPDK